VRNTRHDLGEDGLTGVHPASDPENAFPVQIVSRPLSAQLHTKKPLTSLPPLLSGTALGYR
jgi:hypothetical protein